MLCYVLFKVFYSLYFQRREESEPNPFRPKWVGLVCVAGDDAADDDDADDATAATATGVATAAAAPVPTAAAATAAASATTVVAKIGAASLMNCGSSLIGLVPTPAKWWVASPG